MANYNIQTINFFNKKEFDILQIENLQITMGKAGSITAAVITPFLSSSKDPSTREPLAQVAFTAEELSATTKEINTDFFVDKIVAAFNGSKSTIKLELIKDEAAAE